jgi:hypothetical protein
MKYLNHHSPLHVLFGQGRSKREYCRLEDTFAAQDCEEGTSNDHLRWQDMLKIPWVWFSTSSQRMTDNIPTVIAQILIPTLGTRFDNRTTLTPHLSATKLNGMVTTKSTVDNVSNLGSRK